jgi:hypothetical protein
MIFGSSRCRGQKPTSALGSPMMVRERGTLFKIGGCRIIESAAASIACYCGAEEVLSAVGTALAGVPPPDFHIPQGPGRLGALEPPRQFLHWTDRLEIVLPPIDVVRRCQTGGAQAARRCSCHTTPSGLIGAEGLSPKWPRVHAQSRSSLAACAT